MKENLLQILQSSRLCKGLTTAQIQNLVTDKHINYIEHPKNEILFFTDKTPDKLYVLVNGNIAMAKDTRNGNRILSKSNTTPGELIGEVRLFSSKKLLWEYAVTLEKSSVLEVSSHIFLEAGTIESSMQVILLKNIIENVVDKIDNLGQKVRILSIPSVRERISFYLFSIQDENNQIFLHTTREALADYLGIARPSLSRELGRMQDEGIIQIRGHEVFILNQAIFEKLFE